MEHELQLRIPCWVIADGTVDDLQQASQIVLMQANGKSIVPLFLDKPEAERFVKEAGLAGRIPLTIGSIQNLALLTGHLQKEGAHEVQVFFQAGDEVTRATVPIEDFNDGLRQHLSEPSN